jgi:periplasmic divalent cation tolerance protein
MLGVLLDREMPRRNRVAPKIAFIVPPGSKEASYAAIPCLSTTSDRACPARSPSLVAGSVLAMSMSVTLALTTVGSEEDAARIARHLVQTKAAACVSIVSPVRSFYVWKGEFQDEKEWLLFIKTARPAGELRDALRDIHPYEVPEFLAFPASFADEAYARWVTEGSVGPTEEPGPEGR